MNFYDFIMALNFGQWIGIIILTTIVCGTIAEVGRFMFNRKSDDDSSSENTQE